MSYLEVLNVAQAWASVAEAEHHAPSITQIIFPLGNFLIYAYIIKRFALPVVRDFLRSRRAEIITSIESAAESKKQAEAVVSSYQAKLAGIQREVDALQAELRAEGEREKGKLIGEAETLAAKIKDDTVFLADQEVNTARQKIRYDMAVEA
ncbi:MAG: ATP synthase F0 subunit B, partial [Deltaproteobacteria bacterium]|nr:ATP synthase F0 subunit B [Deltaproteobacteria bacterium]